MQKPAALPSVWGCRMLAGSLIALYYVIGRSLRGTEKRVDMPSPRKVDVPTENVLFPWAE